MRKIKPVNHWCLLLAAKHNASLINNLTHLFHREETEAQESSINLGRLYQFKTFSLCSDRKPNPKPLKKKKLSIWITEVRHGFLQRLRFFPPRFWFFSLPISMQCFLCSLHIREAVFFVWQDVPAAQLHPTED